jgi:hypothetical protein
VYSCKKSKCAIPSKTTTEATVTRLTARTENVGHKLNMDNSCPDLFDDLHTKNINSCGTVRPSRNVMDKSTQEKMKLKRVTQRLTCDKLTATVWRKMKCKHTDKNVFSTSRR